MNQSAKGVIYLIHELSLQSKFNSEVGVDGVLLELFIAMGTNFLLLKGTEEL